LKDKQSWESIRRFYNKMGTTTIRIITIIAKTQNDESAVQKMADFSCCNIDSGTLPHKQAENKF